TTEDPLDHFMEVNYGFGLPIKSSLEKDSLSCNNQYIPSKIEISRSLTTFTVCQGRYVDTSIAILAFDSNKSPSTLVRDIITSDSNLTNKTSMKCIQDKSFQLNKNMPNYVLDCTYQINSRSLFTSVLVLYPIKVLGIGNAIVITGSSENETKENLREVSKKIVYLPY
ncbi:MAG: hypothetical protein JWQ09_3905, partial [Segetibacter sp.]|nr:hypothetical protein [Segetibacter sp.]